LGLPIFFSVAPALVENTTGGRESSSTRPVISRPDDSGSFADFFSVFPAVGFTGAGEDLPAGFNGAVFAGATFSGAFADAFGAVFGIGLATAFGIALLDAFDAGFTGALEADLGADLGATFAAFGNGLATGLAAAFPTFGAGLAGAFFATGFAAADFFAGFAAGLETGFAGFFTLEDTGLTGFAGFFSPFDAPDFTTVPADALEGFAFITTFAGFFAAAGAALASGFPACLPAALVAGLTFAAGFDLALFSAAFGAFFFADGMGLGSYWVRSPRLCPTAALAGRDGKAVRAAGRNAAESSRFLLMFKPKRGSPRASICEAWRPLSGRRL
jgi:hypothetical protein